MKLLPADQSVLDLFLGEDPLVGQVVDREHAPGVRKETLAIHMIETDRRQRGRPVVGMDHIGFPIEHLA